MKFDKLILGGAIAAALSAIASTAEAYRAIEKDGVPVGWTEDEVLFDLEDVLPAGISFTEAQAQLERAAALWNANSGCGAPRIRINPVPAGVGASGDNRNTIQWVFSDWAKTGENPDASGYSDVLIETLDGSSRIREVDIWFNAESFDWTAGTARPPAVMGVYATAAHEMGHALGLDHPCEYGSAQGVPDCAIYPDQSALMFPVMVSAAPQITFDDLAGLCSIYSNHQCSSGDAACQNTSKSATPPGCLTTSDCDAGELCEQNACVVAPRSLGDSCDNSRDCASSVCFEGACRAACAVDEKCANGAVCDTNSMTCAAAARAMGSSCSAPEQCISGLCYIGSEPKDYCTRSCSLANPCPKGWDCTTNSEQETFCVLPAEQANGCTVARVGKASDFGWLGLLGGFLLMGFRRFMRTQAVK